MIAWLCLVLGGLVLLIGWGLLQPPDDERRRRASGDRLELRGRVVLDDRRQTIVAPFSKREVVWLRVDVDEVQRSPHGAWDVRVHMHDDTRSVAFHVEDEAGRRTHVSLESADVHLPRHLVMDQTAVQTAPPEALSYLTQTNIDPLDRAGFAKKMWFYERALCVGDDVLLVGRATPERTEVESYRSAERQAQRVARVGPENELVVNKTTDARLLATVRPFRSLGWSMAVLGAVSVLLGLAVYARG